MAPSVVERLRSADRAYRILAAIVLGGAVFRLLNLGSRPFWSDEALYSLASMEVVRELVFYPHYPSSEALVTGHPPMFYVITGSVAQFTGSMSELVMRFPTAVFGVLSIIVVYLLAQELFDTSTGLIAALFLSVSTTHVIYSREALPVVIGLFFLSLSALSLVKWFPLREWRTTAVVVGLAVAALFSHFMNYSLFFLFAGLIATGYWKRKRIPWGSAGIFLLLIVFALSFMFFTLDQSTPPTTSNPVKGGFGIDEGVISSLGAVVTFVQWIWGFVSALSIENYLSVFLESLELYFNETVAYTSVPLFLAPLLYAGWRYWNDGNVEQEESLFLTYFWFLGSLAMIVAFIWPVYYHQNLRPTRAYPFLLIPFILLSARGALELWNSQKNWLRVIPVVFVLLSFTHVVPVAADTPAYFNYDPFNGNVWMAHGASQSALRIDIDVRVPGSGLDVDIDSITDDPFTDTIVCGDNPTGVVFVCYPDHPVGYTDSINWREATEFTLSRSGAGAKYYVSVAPPFLYYADADDLDVTGLQCNVDHRFCNVMDAVRSPENPVWIVADSERYGWQLNEQERNYVEDNCDAWNTGNVNIFRCT